MWQCQRCTLPPQHLPSLPRAEGERPRAWVPPCLIILEENMQMHTEIINPTVSTAISGLVLYRNRWSWSCLAWERCVRIPSTHIVDFLSCWAEFDRLDYNPYRTGMEGKMHLLLCIYRTAVGLPFFFFFLWLVKGGVAFWLWTHGSHQSPPTVSKSMFNLPHSTDTLQKNNCLTTTQTSILNSV